MKQTTLYILILLSSLLAACQDDGLPGTGTTPEGGSLRIAYRVAGTDVQTKVTLPDTDTEAGNTNLNENKVTRLDLFVDKGSGSFIHIPKGTMDEVTNASTAQPLALTDNELDQIGELTADMTLYLVANCEGCDDISTLADLQALTTSGNFNFRGTQTTFVMDGSHTITANNLASNDVVITIELRRALSKIRFSFGSSEEGTLTLNNYRFFNYAGSTSVLASEEDHHNSLQSMGNYESFSGETLPLTDTGDNGQTRYIFYSYPNDWYDGSVAETIRVEEDDKEDYEDDGYKINSDNLLTNQAGDILYEFSGDGLHNGEPIDPARQTYLMLQATYNNEEGYYRIPVNHHLPQESDQPYFTQSEIDALHDYYYRLKRNHLYDIAVTIDGPGGTLDDPVEPEYTITINDWIHDGEYHLSPGEFN